LSFRESLTILEILKDRGTGEIDVMGGEPLLLPWMPDFAKKASEEGMKVNISTNGSCLTAIDRFRDTDPEKITIGVSLEGSSEKRHNTVTASSHFSLAIEAIKTLLSFGLNLVVKTVVSRTTAPDIPNIISLLRELGARRYYLIHMDVLTRDPAVMKESFSYPEFKLFYDDTALVSHDMEIFPVSASCFSKEAIGQPARCSGGVNKLSILPDGSVFPCNLFHRSPDFCLGNIMKDDFLSIWANPRLKAFREYAGNTCDDHLCVNRTSCTGGCPAHGHIHSGNFNGRDVRCELSPSTSSINRRKRSSH
jgi:radical SAM protein with 4Fe4S-binding SPASM domain